LTITLFENGKADSKIHVINAIKKHYPEQKYLNYFKDGSEMPEYYREAFSKKMLQLCQQYRMP